MMKVRCVVERNMRVIFISGYTCAFSDGFSTKQLQREYNRLAPSLQDLQKKDSERKKRTSEAREVFGVSQAFELGQRFNEQ
jgi:hypothetical protein